MNSESQNNKKLDIVLFEYPSEEKIRSYLRLELLFKQFQRNLNSSNKDNHFFALKVLFEILDILERGDTRPELIKELSRLLHYFKSLEENPAVDMSKLASFLKQIQQLHQWIHNYHGKFGESIRRHPFIESAKHRMNIPGGSSPFDCPELFLFLNRPCETRQKLLNEFISDIRGVETSISVILKLIRDTGVWKPQIAPLGTFVIDASEQNIKLLRIKNVSVEDIFPEFSCGKHRSTIHFMSFDQNNKKTPVSRQVTFELACCN